MFFLSLGGEPPGLLYILMEKGSRRVHTRGTELYEDSRCIKLNSTSRSRP